MTWLHGSCSCLEPASPTDVEGNYRTFQGLGFTLPYIPGSWFHIALHSMAWVSHYLTFQGLDFTLPYIPGSWFHIALHSMVWVSHYLTFQGLGFTLPYIPGSWFHITLHSRVLVSHYEIWSLFYWTDILQLQILGGIFLKKSLYVWPKLNYKQTNKQCNK
jgi:hypothetical protein